MAKKTNSAAARGVLAVAALALTPLLASPQAAAVEKNFSIPGVTNGLPDGPTPTTLGPAISDAVRIGLGQPHGANPASAAAAPYGPATLGPPSGLVHTQIGFGVPSTGYWGAPTGQPHGVIVEGAPAANAPAAGQTPNPAHSAAAGQYLGVKAPNMLGAPYSQSAVRMPGYSYPTMSGYSYSAMQGYSYPAMQGYSYPAMQGYSYPAMQGYSYPYMSGYSYPYASGYRGGTVVWVPMMMPAAPGKATPGGQAAPASTPMPNAAPNAGGTGRTQAILCMVAPKVRSATTPSRIAVIANSETECAAIGGSAAQTATRK